MKLSLKLGKIEKAKRKIEKVNKKLEMIFSFPHIWACCIIIIFSFILLFFSYFLDENSNTYWSSILANISAGLITGFVIYLISGIKQMSTIKFKIHISWLEDIREKIQEYDKYYNKLLYETQFEKINRNEEIFNLIYDTSSRANWINDTILTGSSYEYFKKTFDYDAAVLREDFEALHDKLVYIDMYETDKKQVLKYFSNINSNLKKIKDSVYKELQETKIKLGELEKTIL